MKKSLFTLDALNDAVLEGFDTGEDWNGWAVPVFAYDQACKIVEAWQRNGWEAHYDNALDAFVFGVSQNIETGHSEEFDRFEAFRRDGEKFYAIGSGAWTWDTAEDEIALMSNRI